MLASLQVFERSSGAEVPQMELLVFEEVLCAMEYWLGIGSEADVVKA